jgi:hypothetical protein
MNAHTNTHGAGSVSAQLEGAGLVEEEVFENERWVALKGWSPSNLRPETDPGRFGYGARGYPAFPEVCSVRVRVRVRVRVSMRVRVRVRVCAQRSAAGRSTGAEWRKEAAMIGRRAD